MSYEYGYYNASQDYSFFGTSEEVKRNAEKENDIAIEYYNKAMSHYDSGHYDDARWEFKCALNYAHDRNLISDCNEMFDKCNEAMANLYMR